MCHQRTDSSDSTARNEQALRKKSLVTDNNIQISIELNKTCKVRGWMEYRWRGRLLFEKGLGIAVEGRFVRAFM